MTSFFYHLKEQRNAEYPKAVALRKADDWIIPASVLCISFTVGILPLINKAS